MATTTNPRRIRVEGLRELSRAFALADKTLAKEFREGLKDAAEPIRSDATTLARTSISRITVPWSEMRIGVTRTSVYVAPRQRQTRDPRRKRKNLANLLLGEAMLPALARNVGEVEDRVDDVLGTVGRVWERA